MRALALAALLTTASAAWLAPTAANAQFAMTPAPLPPLIKPSVAANEQEYRRDGASHLYACYPMRIYKGRLPPLLHGVAVVETELDSQGNVVEVRFKRPPAAAEVSPWIEQMIRKAGPFPPPSGMGRGAVYTDIWLVHKGGRFQLDTLTEGQD